MELNLKESSVNKNNEKRRSGRRAQTVDKNDKKKSEVTRKGTNCVSASLLETRSKFNKPPATSNISLHEFKDSDKDLDYTLADFGKSAEPIYDTINLFAEERKSSIDSLLSSQLKKLNLGDLESFEVGEASGVNSKINNLFNRDTDNSPKGKS